uniref:Protein DETOXIFICATION n=1 Tax=Kalanchoe fedtschenkoi TaxID=63787 RepID=A0A7N0RHL8_KALFE
MDYTGNSEESQQLILEHGHRDRADSRQASVEGERDNQVINGFTLSLAEGAEELVSLAKVTCPFLMTSMLMYSRSMTSLYFLGRLGKVELAGGALALAFANVTGFSIIKGLSVGMDPICSQAFGAKRWAVIGQTYLKTVCLLLLASIPISCLWLNAEPLFLVLGQDSEIIRVANVYLACLIPELIAQAHLHPLRCFLRCQGKTTPFTIASTCCVVLHLPINYLLAVHLNLGVKGVALAFACSTLNLNAALILYLILSDSPLKPWDKTTFQSIFRGWKPLLDLAIPTVVGVCLEWWWYELMLFLSGLLDNPQSSIAATGILIQTTGLLYNVPYSLSAGLTARVGNALGAGQPSRAQWATIIGILLAFVFGLVAFIFTIMVRSVWGRLFTGESQILDLISTALPLLGLCELGNAPQTAACGVLTGIARPTIGARINLFAFYLVGAPVAVVLTFTFKFGFSGLWLGLASAQGSCVCMMLYFLFKTDWTQQVKKAKELTIAAGHEDDDLEASFIVSDDHSHTT